MKRKHAPTHGKIELKMHGKYPAAYIVRDDKPKHKPKHHKSK